MAKRERKADTKLVEYDTAQIGFIYEAVWPSTPEYEKKGLAGLSFYVGKSLDILRRAAQHGRLNSGAKLLRQMLKTADFKFADVVQLVPEAPNGVPMRRMDEFEGFFMIRRKTLYDPSDPVKKYGCNQNHAAHIVELTPERYAELEAEVKEGVKLELSEWQRAVVAARAKEAMLSDVKDAMAAACEADEMMAADESPPSSDEMIAAEKMMAAQLEAATTALAAATVEREGAELVEPGALGAAKRERDRYEAMLPHAMVSRDDVTASLNTVTSAAPDDDALGRQIKGLMPAVHSDKFPNQPVPAALAKHVLAVVVEWLGKQAEEAIDVDDTVMKGLRALRDWSAAHGGKKPSTSAADAAERTHGRFFSNWSGKTYGRRHEAEARILYRHYPMLLKVVDPVAISAATELRTRDALTAGYSWHSEPFDGDKIPSAAPEGILSGVFVRVRKIVHGEISSEATVLRMLVGLTDERRNWYLGKWSSARPAYIESQAKNAATRQAKMHGYGVKPRGKQNKKAKTESESQEADESESQEADEVEEAGENDGGEESEESESQLE